MTKSSGNQRPRRTGGNITKDGGLEKKDKTTDRDGLEIMDWTEGQADWMAGSVEKLKPRAERSRETVEKHGAVESAKTGVEQG